MDNNKEPTFDKDGYPTDETLALISEWDYKDPEGLFAFIKKAWRYPDYFKETEDEYQISTAGWSGNESLISALESNLMIFSLYWLSSKRGGHYVYKKR